MKKLIVICLLVSATGGCASMHSPYDLHTWCLRMGSARLTSIGEQAHDPRNCDKELEEDLADRTPRILYAPRDLVMSPVYAARGVWALLGMTEPPF
jgi:hypothetical protein